jgi:gliding motility-associated-like protein
VVVQAAPVPQVTLGPDTLVCEYAPTVLLRPSPQPAGTTYRWQDGRTDSTYLARQAGTYRVEVRNTAGCIAQAQVTITFRTCPVIIPNIITPNGDGSNDYWALQGVNPGEWSVRIFSRWGQPVHTTEAYDNRWQAAGLAGGIYYYYYYYYYYYLRHARTGQVYRSWVEVVR